MAFVKWVTMGGAPAEDRKVGLSQWRWSFKPRTCASTPTACQRGFGGTPRQYAASGSRKVPPRTPAPFNRPGGRPGRLDARRSVAPPEFIFSSGNAGPLTSPA